MATLNWRVLGHGIIPEDHGGVCPQKLVMPENSSYKPKVARVHRGGSTPTYNV